MKSNNQKSEQKVSDNISNTPEEDLIETQIFIKEVEHCKAYSIDRT